MSNAELILVNEVKSCTLYTIQFLSKFDRLIKEGVKDGSIVITENQIQTDKTLDL